MGYASIQADGSHEARTGSQTGLRPGEYRVTIVAAVEPAPAKHGEPEALLRLLIPARYGHPDRSGLSYTVPARGGRFDIVLER